MENTTSNANVLTGRSALLEEKAQRQQEREKEKEPRQESVSAVSSLKSMIELRTVARMRTAGAEEHTVEGVQDVFLSGFLEYPGGRIKVLVPFSEVYTKEIIDMSTVDLTTSDGVHSYNARRKKMLSKMLGIEADICVNRVIEDPDSGGALAVASRKDACAKLRQYNFYDAPRCAEGGRYTATVISVAPHSLALSYAGVDGVVIQGVLTERYLNSLYDRYHAGDKVDFIARNIKVSENGDVTMDFATKEAELDSFRNRYSGIPVGTLARGTVSRVYRSGERCSIYAWLPDWELAAKIPEAGIKSFAKPLHSGDDVLLKVTGYRRSGYLDARIYSVSGSAGLFSHF